MESIIVGKELANLMIKSKNKKKKSLKTTILKLKTVSESLT